MEESTSSSTNQLPVEEGKSSNSNLQPQSPRGINLLDIPVLRPSKTESSSNRQDLSFSAPLSYDDGKVEYEFTCIATDSTPMFVGLWDTDDLSACQRVSACKMDRDEIVYDQSTGVGFFKTVDGLRWCFRKSPIQRTAGPFNLLDARGDEEKTTKSKATADDIIASI